MKHLLRVMTGIILVTSIQAHARWMVLFSRTYGAQPFEMSNHVDSDAAEAHFKTILEQVAQGRIDHAYAELLNLTPSLSPQTGIWTLPLERLPKLSIVDDGLNLDAATLLRNNIMDEWTSNTDAKIPLEMLGLGHFHSLVWPRIYYRESRLHGGRPLDLISAAEAPLVGALKIAAILHFIEEYRSALSKTEAIRRGSGPLAAECAPRLSSMLTPETVH